MEICTTLGKWRACRDLEATWAVVEPLLQPLVTPATAPVHPVRELHERCQRLGLPLKFRVVHEPQGNNGANKGASAYGTLHGAARPNRCDTSPPHSRPPAPQGNMAPLPQTTARHLTCEGTDVVGKDDGPSQGRAYGLGHSHTCLCSAGQRRRVRMAVSVGDEELGACDGALHKQVGVAASERPDGRCAALTAPPPCRQLSVGCAMPFW